MSDLFLKFGGSSKQKWLDKVTIDLKGKPLDSLDISLFDSIHISPFAHRDDIQEDINIPLPYFDQTVLGCRVIVTDEEQSNALVLDALGGGASHVELIITDHKEIDFKRLFDGVMIDLIHVDVTIKDQINADGLVHYLCANYEEEAIKNICIHGQSTPSFISQKSSLGKVESPNIDSLINFLTSSSSAIELDKNASKFAVEVTVGHNYMETVSFIRAVRLLWSNVIAAHGCSVHDYPLVITGSISYTVIRDSKYDNMISFSQMITAMISAGIDVIMIPPSDVKEKDTGSEFSRRISRNIYHLLDQESHMMKVSDPVAGSYFFDHMTIKVAENAWNMFIKERTNA